MYYMIEQELKEIAKPPFILWGKIITRIKVMARMVDYGQEKSIEGTIVIDKNIPVTFRVTSNPDPATGTNIAIVLEG